MNNKGLKEMNNIIYEIKNLKYCGPSDDPDEQTSVLLSLKFLSKKFVNYAKKIYNIEIINMISNLYIDIDYFSEVFDLAHNLDPIFDEIENLQQEGLLIYDPNYSQDHFQKIVELISETLAEEKAYDLPNICVNLGLALGDKESAYKGKRTYVASRLKVLSPGELLNVSLKLNKKYKNQELLEIIHEILQSDNLNIFSTFEDIKANILKEIEGANFLIWVAVAWFTDRDILRALWEKQIKGINVQIILIDDDINKKLDSESTTKLEDVFEIIRIPTINSFDNIMHNKFCIIDLKKVITGSYNWTTKAQYNKESISIIESRLQAEIFAKEFISLKKII